MLAGGAARWMLKAARAVHGPARPGSRPGGSASLPMPPPATAAPAGDQAVLASRTRNATSRAAAGVRARRGAP